MTATLSSSDWSVLIQSVSAAIIAVLTYTQGRRVGKSKGHEEAFVRAQEYRDKRYEHVEKELRLALRRNTQLKDRVSALETELVVMRKLVPGGEWARLLGIEHDTD